MTAADLGRVLAGLDREEREVFLLCLADELPSEEASRWLRGNAHRLRPLGNGTTLWWWFLESEHYTEVNTIPEHWHSILSGARGGKWPSLDTSVHYASEESAWADLFWVLLLVG